MDFLKAITALSKWKFTAFGVAALSFALVALAPSSEVKHVTQYSSQAKILLTPPSGQVSAFGGAHTDVGTDRNQSWFADPTVLTELLQSEELLTRVQASSGSKEGWGELRSMIEVEPLSQSAYGVKLFKLAVTSDDPKESQKITRLITEEFSTYVQELSAREFASTRKFIEELVAEAEQRRLQAEDSLQVVREKYLGVPSDTEVQSQQASIDNQRQVVTSNIPSLQAEVAALKSYLDGHVQSPPWSILQKTDGSLSALETAVAENKVKVSQAQEIYTDENENVVNAKARLAKSEELYSKGLNDYVGSLYNSKSLELQQSTAREQALSSRLNALLASQMTPDDRRTMQKLERELTLWEENHLSLLQQLYQARVVEQSSRRQGSVNILEQPLPGMPVMTDAVPMGTSRTKKLAMSIPFCLILGAAAAMLREYLTSSLKLRPRIEEALELPVIAVIPATPSELTVDWERFKRPMQAANLGGLAQTRSKVLANAKHTSNGSNGSNGHAGIAAAGRAEHVATVTEDDNYKPRG